MKGRQEKPNTNSFELLSDTFGDGENIPQKFTCDATDGSLKPPYPPHPHPHFKWHHAPENTKSFALICDDPDAPREKPWVHWVVYNIPSETNHINLQMGREKILADGTIQGTNSYNDIGYDGPCPPKGEKPHKYHFTLYALDTDLNLRPGAMKAELVKAMDGHILGKTELTGKYQR